MSTQITWFDYLVLILALSISVLIGFYHGFRDKLRKLFKTKNGEQTTSAIELDPIEVDREPENRGKTSEYLMANSSMGTFPVAMSLLATVYSATSLLGVPAEVYQYGIQFWISAFAQSLCPLIGAFITGPFFASHNVHSIFEYFELRFNSKYVRTVASICYVIKNSITCAIFMYGPATSLALLANLKERTCIALLGFIGTLYTAIGGIRGVIWNDLFQALIMFVSLFIIILKGVYDAGGLWNLFETNSRGGRLNLLDFNPDPFIRQSFWSILIGQVFYMSTPYCFDQQMIQRFQASRTKKIAVRALILNCPGVFLLISLCCCVGLILYAIYSGCDPLITKQISTPNQLVGLFVVNSFMDYPGIAGLFLASLFCGSLSSVSSFLNSQAAIIWHDLLKPFEFFRSLNDVKSLTTNKILVLISGLVATCLAFLISTLGGNISQISYSLNGAFTSPILGLFLLGMFFSVTTSRGATIGIIVGFFAALWISMGAYITKPKYSMLNVTIEFCPNSTDFNFSPLTFQNNRTVVMASDLTGINKFYSLSYMWFTPFGVLVTIIVGLFASIIDTYCFSGAVEDENVVNQKPKHNKNEYIYYDLCCFSC